MQGTCTLWFKIIWIQNNSESSDSELEAVSQDDTSSDEDSTPTIKYHKWATIDSKVQQIAVEIDLQEANYSLIEKVNILKQHIYIQYEQYRKYNEIKANLKDKEMLLHVDFAENYHNKQRSGIQSAYFGHTGFSVFTACCYLKENKELKKHRIAVVTKASDHSCMATHCLTLKVIDEVNSQYPRFSDFEKLSIHL